MSQIPDSFDGMIESKYLKKEDFNDGARVLTIRNFERENIAQEGEIPEFKFMLHFVELAKPLVLNSTNIQILKAAYGSPAASIGQRVQVYIDPNVSFGGKLVGGLRLRGPSKKPPAAPPRPAEPVANVDDFADDIPF